jgi:hypothetical protein
MLAPILGTLLALQQLLCLPSAARVYAEASARASQFDVPGALEALHTAAGCEHARVAATYLQGLLDARDAARVGGTTESLAPVREAMDALQVIGRNRRGPAEIARLVLHAAAAAAQSERDEMRLYIETAARMEALQRAAGEEGAPLVTAVEMAGALWLQVDRYEEARLAYAEAERVLGPTPRVSLGLARAAVRRGDWPAACTGYRAVVERWTGATPEPQELVEGRAYLARPECQVRVP